MLDTCLAEYFQWPGGGCSELRSKQGIAALFSGLSAQPYALAEIATANLIEQGGWTQSRRDLYCLGLDHPTCLSTGAKAVLHQSWQVLINHQQVAA